MSVSILNALTTAQAIKADIDKFCGPPEEGRMASNHTLVMRSLVKDTRGYIEKIANQANGTYENGWFDASAVMLRRLLETLIIECFEKHQIELKIKDSQGNFLFLRDMIAATLAEPKFNLGRNTKQALPKLKDLGDKSAHSRRFIAQKADIEPLIPDIRVVVQELLYISDLK